MAQPATIDATNIPDVRRAAEEANKRQEPIVIQTNGEDVAVVMPLDETARLKRFVPTSEQIEAALAAAGSWKGLIDVDELKAYWRATRGSNRPPVDL